MVSLLWTKTVSHCMDVQHSYNRDQIEGQDFKMFRSGKRILLQGYGIDDNYVDIDKVAIRTAMDDRLPYMQMSIDDEFTQGHECTVDRIGEDGVFYIVNSTWKPHPFAKLPERILINNNLDINQATGKFYMWFDGRELCHFIDIAGNWFTALRSNVTVVSKSRTCTLWWWYEVDVRETHDGLYATVEIKNREVPELKKYLRDLVKEDKK